MSEGDSANGVCDISIATIMERDSEGVYTGEG
jgi:hypothetical protein